MRERDRQRQTERDRDRETQRERDRDRETERGKKRIKKAGRKKHKARCLLVFNCACDVAAAPSIAVEQELGAILFQRVSDEQTSL